MMDAHNFAYWLNGFAELNGDTPPSKAQWKSIREHLGLVFEKVTPPVSHRTTQTPFIDWYPSPSPGQPLTTKCVSGGSVSPMPSLTTLTC